MRHCFQRKPRRCRANPLCFHKKWHRRRIKWHFCGTNPRCTEEISSAHEKVGEICNHGPDFRGSVLEPKVVPPYFSSFTGTMRWQRCEGEAFASATPFSRRALANKASTTRKASFGGVEASGKQCRADACHRSPRRHRAYLAQQPPPVTADCRVDTVKCCDEDGDRACFDLLHSAWVEFSQLSQSLLRQPTREPFPADIRAERAEEFGFIK